jgi:hypothetical protein
MYMSRRFGSTGAEKERQRIMRDAFGRGYGGILNLAIPKPIRVPRLTHSEIFTPDIEMTPEQAEAFRKILHEHQVGGSPTEQSSAETQEEKGESING